MANGWIGTNGARLVAAGRVAAGVGFLARPDLFPKMLGVDSGTAARMSWLGRMFGAREVALGAGLLLAGRSPEAARPWLLGGVVADAVDAVALGAAVRSGVVRAPVGLAFAAMGAAATGTGVVAWLDRGD